MRTWTMIALSAGLLACSNDGSQVAAGGSSSGGSASGGSSAGGSGSGGAASGGSKTGIAAGSSAAGGAAGSTSAGDSHYKIDQFGYFPGEDKVARLTGPVNGIGVIRHSTSWNPGSKMAFERLTLH